MQNLKTISAPVPEWKQARIFCRGAAQFSFYIWCKIFVDARASQYAKNGEFAAMNNKNRYTHISILAVLCAVAVAAFVLSADAASALTGHDVRAAIFEALGHEVPAKYLTEVSDDATRAEALRVALDAIGWGFVVHAADEIGILPEWPEIDGLTYVLSTMEPPAPEALVSDMSLPVTEEDLALISEWLAACKQDVRWRASFAYGGTELTMIKRGVADPEGSPNGDIEHGVNEPLYAATLAVDMQTVPCRIATAIMVGANKAPLATIAAENYGVIGGINGGYFAGAKPIGVLRRQGYTDSAKFWPNRSAFGWNESGEYIFIDGKYTADIAANKKYDKYTEVLQAGPLLVKDGALSPNTEKIHPNVMDHRHPRTFVATDGNRVYWGVVDGRDKMHSVGMTIQELRHFCAGLGMKQALNLDGGGSSSLWWRGMTFSLPSNAHDDERPIPYAILMFEEGADVRR